jgi:hypothetical protein
MASDEVRAFRLDEEEEEDEEQEGEQGDMQKHRKSILRSRTSEDQSSSQVAASSGGSPGNSSSQTSPPRADKARADAAASTSPGGIAGSGILGKFFGAASPHRVGDGAPDAFGSREELSGGGVRGGECLTGCDDLEWVMTQPVTCQGYLKKEHAKGFGFATRYACLPAWCEI